MRKVLISIAALSAALAATPSMAQSWGNPGGYGQYGNGQYGNGGYRGDRDAVPTPWQVRDMVERAIQRGDISRGEARDLRDDVRDLFRLDQRTRRYGDYGARRDLQRKTFEVLRNLREARRDDGRDGRYGYGDRDSRDDHGGRDNWNR